MRYTLLTVLLAAAAPAAAQDRAGPASLEGKWLIVYVEEGGKRNAAWEQQVATVKGDTLSYSKEGEDRSLKLAFGPGQTVRVAGAGKGGGKGPGEMAGVYIASKDYFSLSVNPAGAKGGDKEGSSGEFILILRRQR